MAARVLAKAGQDDGVAVHPLEDAGTGGAQLVGVDGAPAAAAGRHPRNLAITVGAVWAAAAIWVLLSRLVRPGR